MMPGPKPRPYNEKHYINAFVEKIDKRSHSECWKWLGGKSKYGYGIFHILRKPIRAHRLAWELFFGPIPEGKLVLHKCRNRDCVNPYHLYLGSQSDNMKDAVRDGTHPKLGVYRLEGGQVAKIIELISSGMSLRNIAKAIKVDRHTISEAIKRTTAEVL